MKRKFEVEFALDDLKAFEIAERLFDQFYTRKGFFEDYSMPEYVLHAYLHGESEILDVMYDPLSVKIAEQEGRKAKKIKLPIKASRLEEFGKSLRKREKDPIEKCKKQLHRFIVEKTREMNAAGISNETINSARRRVVDYLDGKPVTHRQLTSLTSGSNL